MILSIKTPGGVSTPTVQEKKIDFCGVMCSTYAIKACALL